jgi:hypothetical protein
MTNLVSNLSDNRVLMGVLGPKRHEVKRKRRQMQNEELHNFYSPPNTRPIKARKRLAGHLACNW